MADDPIIVPDFSHPPEPPAPLDPAAPDAPALQLPRPAPGGARPAGRPNRAEGPEGPRALFVEMAYHQCNGQQPTVAEARFGRLLETDEQPYQRRLSVGPEWAPLELGWVARASYVIIANREGENLQARPTAAERAAYKARVVELSFRDDGRADLELRPGESLRLAPAAGAALRARCRAGSARCLLTVFPA